MASVKSAVKESLVGSTEEPQVPSQVKGNFYRHARKDESGDLYMNEEDFINAIAPAQEDYVSSATGCKFLGWTSADVV